MFSARILECVARFKDSCLESGLILLLGVCVCVCDLLLFADILPGTLVVSERALNSALREEHDIVSMYCYPLLHNVICRWHLKIVLITWLWVM